MSVKVNMKPGWAEDIEKSINKGLLNMVTDIDRRAVILTPVLTGLLKGSAKISPIPKGYTIGFGSGRVPYARRQYFENRTKSGWLWKAADNVGRSNMSRYWL
jgi:hypothetical protein